MRRCLLSFLLLIVGLSRIEAACTDPSAFVRSTMSITRHFNEEERNAEPDVIAIRGTAWFLSSRLLVTAAHVASAIHLSAHEWKDVEMLNGEGKGSVSVRLLHLAGLHAEKVAVIELSRTIPDAAVLERRAEPLIADEPVVSLAYPGNQLRFAGGRFVQQGSGEKF